MFSYFQGSDNVSTSKLLVAIVSISFENKKWDLLNENLVLLTKRRGQIKQVSTHFSDRGCLSCKREKLERNRQNLGIASEKNIFDKKKSIWFTL